jgi:hypothetical protein
MSNSSKSELITMVTAAAVVTTGALALYKMTSPDKDKSAHTQCSDILMQNKKLYISLSIVVASFVAFGVTQLTARKLITDKWEDFLEGDIPANL